MDSRQKALLFWDRLAVIISVAIYFLLGLMRRMKFDVDWDTSILPAFNAAVNTGVALLLVASRWAIARRYVEWHKRGMIAALLLSLVFLASYVVYHFTTPETPYCKDDWTRGVYYFILTSHILLAGLSLPFILLTFNRARLGLYDRHKTMARKVFPIWLYVAVTGPIVYWMLKPCYAH